MTTGDNSNVSKKLHEDNAELTRIAAQGHASLKNILNGMDALICVSESETNEILFLNDKIREVYGIEDDGVGKLCYKLLQGLDEMCAACPLFQLLKEPDKIIIWEHREVKKGRILHKMARLIDWPGNKKAHLEYALDITALREAQKALEQREKMLNLLIRATIVLLSQREETFEETMTEGLQILGGMVRLDRLSIWKNSHESNGLYASQIFQWDRQAGLSKPDETPADISFDLLAPYWKKVFTAGEIINGPVRLLPALDIPHSPDCLSIFINPIFFNKIFWGFALCEDDTCERVFTENESDLLRSSTLMLTDIVIRHKEMVLIREANQRIEAQAHWYKSILDAMPIPVSVTDANMNWALVNKALEAMLGAKYEDMIGKPCSNWNSHICGTEACGIACAKRGMTQTFFKQNDSSYQVDVGILRDLAGETTGFVEVVQDITQVKNMTQRQGEMENSISQLETKVLYDQLTGIYSRQFFEENIKGLISSLSRSGSMLSLMMIDIDYFKQYNDTYGHIKGDACLKIVAETLRNHVTRKEDFVARYGGEEFVAVLPNTNAIGAHMIADRLLKAIQDQRIPHATSAAASCITISIGVVTGKVKHTHCRDDYLKHADEMLYKSKHTGRNKYTSTIL